MTDAEDDEHNENDVATWFKMTNQGGVPARGAESTARSWIAKMPKRDPASTLVRDGIAAASRTGSRD